MLIRKLIMLLTCVFLIGIPFLSISPAPAQACSCAMPSPVSEELERKTAIFSGRVTQITEPEWGPTRSSAAPVEVRLEADTVWKGEVSQIATIYTAMSTDSCGYGNFRVGQEYLVYAYGSPDRLETGLCERTTLLSGAAEDLQQLGAGYAPLPSPPAQGRSLAWTFAGWGAAGAAVLLLAAIITKRRGHGPKP